MDEKTEDLRDIFMEVSDTGVVTKSQGESRGSIADAGSGEVRSDVSEVIAEMRDRYAFETDLPAETYVEIARAVHDEADDAAIAADLDLDEERVFDARLDLHLLRESDTDAPVDLSALRERDGVDADLDAETAERYRRVAAARDEARAANHRYREAFEALLTDADLEGGFADGVREDGLAEAAEDIETDVSF